MIILLCFAHLGGGSHADARPDGADSGLPLQLALWVLVGDSGRNAHSTAARALGPLGGLDQTLSVLHVVPRCQTDDVTLNHSPTNHCTAI